MIKLELTTQQLDDLLQLNHTYVDVPAADRLCHVTGVTENAHFESKRVSLRMGL